MKAKIYIFYIAKSPMFQYAYQKHVIILRLRYLKINSKFHLIYYVFLLKKNTFYSLDVQYNFSLLNNTSNLKNMRAKIKYYILIVLDIFKYLQFVYIWYVLS